VTQETIDVNFVAFPDGTHIWMEANKDYLQKCINSWKESLPPEKRQQYDLGGVLITAGYLRMFKDDYFSIPSSNAFPWPNAKEEESHV